MWRVIEKNELVSMQPVKKQIFICLLFYIEINSIFFVKFVLSFYINNNNDFHLIQLIIIYNFLLFFYLII